MASSVYPFGCDNALARTLGEEFATRYQSATPYPHIVIDSFLPDDVLNRLLHELDDAEFSARRPSQRRQEHLKASYIPSELPAFAQGVFSSLSGATFLTFLEAVTGIQGLIPDPYFLGGGVHEVHNGGYLNIHADFNHHPRLQLERRINVLIYLNKDWSEEYGGQFELWSPDMSACVLRVVPVFNRCVIFNTTSTSWHGNPTPVTHPSGRSRRSVALYFYTATWSQAKRQHNTDFKVRPGSRDKPDLWTKGRDLFYDWLPPAIARCWAERRR